MTTTTPEAIEETRQAAVDVLLHLARGGKNGLPRTAGWGYAEPYTRDWMIAALGILATGNAELIATIRRMLEALALAQSPHGQIPGLADTPADLGSSDTTPLFLIALALYRQVTGEARFLEVAAERARTWLAHQSADDRVMVAQQPTSDWRDEQWVLGNGLYVNTLVYIYLRLYGEDAQASGLRAQMNQPIRLLAHDNPHGAEGLAVPGAPYYALWAYKVWGSTRFDLLGNSLAILSGLAGPDQARAMVAWIEAECARLRAQGQLALDLPPCLFPYIQPADRDWYPRYAEFNPPGAYHNGGVWPFVCGFYVAALIAAGELEQARVKLAALTALVRPAREAGVAFGFNEWFQAQDGRAAGQDWQAWSAALYLYAAESVAQGQTPFFAQIR